MSLVAFFAMFIGFLGPLLMLFVHLCPMLVVILYIVIVIIISKRHKRVPEVTDSPVVIACGLPGTLGAFFTAFFEG